MSHFFAFCFLVQIVDIFPSYILYFETKYKIQRNDEELQPGF